MFPRSARSSRTHFVVLPTGTAEVFTALRPVLLTHLLRSLQLVGDACPVHTQLHFARLRTSLCQATRRQQQPPGWSHFLRFDIDRLPQKCRLKAEIPSVAPRTPGHGPNQQGACVGIPCSATQTLPEEAPPTTLLPSRKLKEESCTVVLQIPCQLECVHNKVPWQIRVLTKLN